jgi:hypothetical protein
MTKALLILFVLALGLMPVAGAPSPQIEPSLQLFPGSSASVTKGLYWFQVGAWAGNGPTRFGRSFGITVTGASVEIQARYPQRVSTSPGDISYWVGITLPNDAFIQVGYLISASDGYPDWFWEYFVPGSASEALGRFHGNVGSLNGPNESWVKFSLVSSGTRWLAYVQDQEVGSVDLRVSNSTYGPFAVAEVAGARNANTVLGPVEFRNFAYRDASRSWHSASSAVSLCCYGAGSDTYSGSYPYGVQSFPGENNHWVAGSISRSIRSAGVVLWPWYHATLHLEQGDTTQWYRIGETVDLSSVPNSIQLSTTSRYFLEGWYVNGVLLSNTQGVKITEDLDLKPNYVEQFLVQVSSPTGTATGSGWYDDGANVTIGVTPYAIPVTGTMGKLGVRSVMSGWSGDFHGEALNGESNVQVESPLSIVAVWTTDYGGLPYLTILLFAAAILGSVEVRRNRTRRHHTQGGSS